MKIIPILAAVALLCGCSQRYDGPELAESGEVYDTCFVPEGHGEGRDAKFRPVTVKIPARYAIVFKCQHGKFIVEGNEAELLYNTLNKGDTVTIRYCEVFEVVKGTTNWVDLKFISAAPAPSNL